MEIRPLSARIGAEIDGVDLSDDPDPRTLASIREAFSRYHLLLFRKQTFTPDEQKRFAERFAPTVDTHLTRKDDGLMFISNRERDAAPGDGILPFHSDHTFFKEPDTSVLALYALAVPSAGGDTLWVNAVDAYEDLPPSLKERIVGLRAAHTYKRSDNKSFGALHPLARMLPELGRPVLFVNQFCEHGIEGMTQAEGDALLAELFSYLYREENYYRHKWSVGDFIIWNNQVLQHARMDFDPSEERTLRRSTQGVPEQVIEATVGASAA